jgi:hypothetical protein
MACCEFRDRKSQVDDHIPHFRCPNLQLSIQNINNNIKLEKIGKCATNREHGNENQNSPRKREFEMESELCAPVHDSSA